ncbi:hypothetical protein DNTS_013398, partial [Danionella cerebrum]
SSLSNSPAPLALVRAPARSSSFCYLLNLNCLRDDSADEEPTSQSEHSEIQGTLKTLASKLDDLSTCNELIGKHGAALQRSLSELEALRVPLEGGEKIKTVNERATLFRITSNAMINACRDFLELAESHSRRWQRVLQHEREQRTHLEETIEQLAKQHNSLERAWREAPAHPSSSPCSPRTRSGVSERASKEEASDDEDTEYFDAMEDSPAFITVTATDPSQHRRSQSNLSAASGGHPSDWNQDDCCSVSSNDFSGKDLQPRRKRRSQIPEKPNYSLNLWSIMKNCIGKELSKIPMPVNFNEPLSMLQRLTEDLEYSELLDRAARCESSLEQMCLVAAFSVSSYSTTGKVTLNNRATAPSVGGLAILTSAWMCFRSVIIRLQPLIMWCHSEAGPCGRKSPSRASFEANTSPSCLWFHASGNHYVWGKVTSTVHNIIVGKLWIDQSGDIDIVNHRTKETCQLKFSPYSYFSREVPRKAHYILSGTWDEKMESARILQSSSSEGKQKTVYQTLPPKLLWKKYPLPENAENMYYFSSLALTLNEEEDGVCVTDSRLRPDQRLMEAGRWDEANAEKQRLEEKQRAVRRRREAEASKAFDEGQDFEGYKPLWFHQRTDETTGETMYVYKGGYWEAKDRQDWSMCPEIF